VGSVVGNGRRSKQRQVSVDIYESSHSNGVDDNSSSFGAIGFSGQEADRVRQRQVGTTIGNHQHNLIDSLSGSAQVQNVVGSINGSSNVGFTTNLVTSRGSDGSVNEVFVIRQTLNTEDREGRKGDESDLNSVLTDNETVNDLLDKVHFLLVVRRNDGTRLVDH